VNEQNVGFFAALPELEDVALVFGDPLVIS
jgi:hypothetical protein